MSHKEPLNKKHSPAFTIVELLVVIVVIGILASITIVSYRGITQKATAATIQADLANNSKKLKLYQATYGTYPTVLDANKCPTAPNADTTYCLKASSDNLLPTYTSDGATYSLIETTADSSIAYTVTNGLAPYNSTTTPITAVAAITGTTTIGSTLTAGAITPAAATVSYQWQSATTSGGTYTNISGATASTYAVSPNTMNKYIKVAVTATGSYTGTQTSAATTVVAVDSNWLTIGTQTWAKANLNVGTRIAGASAQTNNGGTNTVEKYCYGDTDAGCTNTDANGVAYGALYQWDEAMKYVTTEGAQGICPTGSHIPTDNDWKILEMSLSGMSQATADTAGWRGTDEGTKLKSGGSSGLNMPLAGWRNTDGSFVNLSSNANLWSTSVSGADAWNRYLIPGNSAVYRSSNVKGLGFSVRCLGN